MLVKTCVNKNVSSKGPHVANLSKHIQRFHPQECGKPNLPIVSLSLSLLLSNYIFLPLDVPHSLAAKPQALCLIVCVLTLNGNVSLSLNRVN